MRFAVYQRTQMHFPQAEENWLNMAAEGKVGDDVKPEKVLNNLNGIISEARTHALRLDGVPQHRHPDEDAADADTDTDAEEEEDEGEVEGEEDEKEKEQEQGEEAARSERGRQRAGGVWARSLLRRGRVVAA